MLKQRKGRVGLVSALVVLVMLAVASPVTAATVYYWTTEDGAEAYTNDAKRIPAKYKKSAKRRTLGKLEEADTNDRFRVSLSKRMHLVQVLQEVLAKVLGLDPGINFKRWCCVGITQKNFNRCIKDRAKAFQVRLFQ